MRKSMPWSEPPAGLRYGAAIAAIAAAVAVGTLLQPALAPVASLLLCGVLFAAWFGGLGPGLLAITFGLLAFDYFFLPPLYSLAVQDYNDVLRLILFALAALFVVALSARQESTAQSLRRAHADLQAAVRELERANASLRDENAQRQRAEAALRRSEQNLQTIIDTIPALVMRYQSDGTSDFMNHTMRDFIGPAVVLDGKNSAVHPEDYPQRLRDWRAHVAAGEPYENEMRLRRADGVYRWHRVTRVPLRDANGAIVSWYGVGFDIDDQKRAEAALREREARLAEAQRELQVMIDTIPVMVASYDADGSLNYVNKTGLDYTGVADVEGMADRERMVAHPDELDQTRGQWRASVATGEQFQTELRLRRHDGEYRWVSTRRVPLRDSSGKIVKWYSGAVDIEDRKRAEDALRRSRAYLAEAQRLSATGSFGWRISDNLIVWSQETYRIFELDPAVKPTRELMLGRTHPDDVELVQRFIERMVNEDRNFDYEHRLLLPNGTIKQLHVRAHRVRFESSDVEVVGALMDVTAARKAEEALRRAQAELAHASRVATLGELSASIAHEVHQPLTAIVASGNAAVRWLDREGPECARAISSITRMISEAHRASQVILRIRELVKKAEPEMAQVDVNRLIEDVLVLISREASGQRVEVRPRLASKLPPALGDRVQLQQVLINLVMNGIQAMAPVTDRARVLVVRTQRHDANQILVAVEDAGVGIAPENLNRLFGAFYTTKPDGMGMGLSISRSIVEAHGGSIRATRNSGPGMTFQFTLSVYREPAAAASPVS
jgi:PAS domain S-box-containing protein